MYNSAEKDCSLFSPNTQKSASHLYPVATFCPTIWACSYILNIFIYAQFFFGTSFKIHSLITHSTSPFASIHSTLFLIPARKPITYDTNYFNAHIDDIPQRIGLHKPQHFLKSALHQMVGYVFLKEATKQNKHSYTEICQY